MKFVIQRVTYASCTVDGTVTGQINNGFCVFIGVAESDTRKIADKMIQKLIGMRIFSDENDKINLSLHDIDGGLLLISQFTLYANCRKGNRPSFTDAGNPQMANEMYEYIISECRKQIKDVQTGIFGAEMKLEIHNDGPFTIILDSDDLAI
jgi:D-tyrosyl-tRNA(Tyr) deacylase